MGNQQNRSSSDFVSNIHSFAEIKKVIDEANLILRFFLIPKFPYVFSK